jgi:predicted enzyme related to lactoylglutathione lyase
MSETHGTVHWNELATRDVGAAKDYYAGVCGWTYEDMPMGEGTYTIAKLGEKMVGGIFDMAAMPGMEQVPPNWMMYLAVDDVDAAAAQTTAGGGRVMRAPWDVPMVGRIAIVTDPTSAVVGLITPAAPPA